MKAYLITTGSLFALLALAHVVSTIANFHLMAAEPGRIVQGPGIGLLAAGLCFWAFRLLRGLMRP